MILVTVGMHSQPFDRLVRAAGELASVVEEPVFVQRGTSSCVPGDAEYADIGDETEMERWLTDARIVISHADASVIRDVLAAGKPLVLAPRMVSLGEDLDDRQLELASTLAGRGRVVVITDLSAESLADAMEQAEQLDSALSGETGPHIALRDWLAEQEAQPPSRRLRFLRWLAGDT